VAFFFCLETSKICNAATFPDQDENLPFVARSVQDLLVSVLTITWTFQCCWDGKCATPLSRASWPQECINLVGRSSIFKPWFSF
jgi:hypothetical protein